MKFDLNTICILWIILTSISKLLGIINISWLLVFMPILLICFITVSIVVLVICVTICCSIGYACINKSSFKEGLGAFKLKLEELEKELQ